MPAAAPESHGSSVCAGQKKRKAISELRAVPIKADTVNGGACVTQIVSLRCNTTQTHKHSDQSGPRALQQPEHSSIIDITEVNTQKQFWFETGVGYFTRHVLLLGRSVPVANDGQHAAQLLPMAALLGALRFEI